MTATSETKRRIKEVLIESLRLDGMSVDEIGDEEPLFGEGLGLDSVDALELVVALEKEYDLRIDSEDMDQEAFSSVERLAAFVEGARAQAESSSAG